MMFALFVGLSAGTMVLQTPDEARRVPARWAIKEVIDPMTGPSAGHEFSWIYCDPIGDPDRDGRSSVFWYGSNNIEYRNLFSWQVLPQRGWEIFQDIGTFWDIRYFFTHGVLDPFCVPLAGPGGFRWVIDDYFNWPSMSVYDLPSRTLVGLIPLPAPPPGSPAIHQITAIFWAGDVDLDGWDDLWYQAPAGNFVVAGLISGATHSVLWQHYEPWPVNPKARVQVLGNGSYRDYDRDGRADFLLGYQKYETSSSFVYRIVALSGRDGAEIWTQDVSGGGGMAAGGSDVTGDGIGDAFVCTSSEWAGLDGATGGLLWSISTAFIPTLLPPLRGNWYHSGSPVVQPSFERPGEHDLFVSIGGQRANTYQFAIELAQLDCQTGAVIGTAIVPKTLEPFHPDPLLEIAHYSIYPLGDIDRDGLNEFCWLTDIRAYALNVFPVYGAAIAGIETLRLPLEAHLGDTLRGMLWIPSAPNHPFDVIASTSFDRAGGLIVDGWHTQLGTSALLSAWLAHRPSHGVLDPEGRAAVALPVPNLPQLAGQTVYSRAVIRRPQSAGEVWTTSSLSRTVLLP